MPLGRDQMVSDTVRRYTAEFLGTAMLLATVVGSGIMGQNLSGGNIAIALLANTIATGAILYVLITIFGPMSGAHFNPAVTLAFWMDDQVRTRDAVMYTCVQILGGILGVWVAHIMFDVNVFQVGTTVRFGIGQWVSECVATAGLIGTILISVQVRKDAVALSVALYITAAYWFTASTSFANPAVSIARCLTNTFSGIRPHDVLPFIGVQVMGALLAARFSRWYLRGRESTNVTPDLSKSSKPRP